MSNYMIITVGVGFLLCIALFSIIMMVILKPSLKVK